MKTAMRCARCDRMAAIRMRHHRLSFCSEHYLEWFVQQTAHTIEKYRMFPPRARLLVAVSGGKDSLSLWDVLWRLGYQADGVYIHLGIGDQADYSDASQGYAQQFATVRQLSLKVISVQKELGQSIPQLAHQTSHGSQRPCSVCGLVKRHVMNQSALEGGYDALLTAHNLDDETAVLLGNALSWQVDLLRRQEPVLEEKPGFVLKAKPFCRFYERETTAYAILRGIGYIEAECPFSTGSKQLEYKAILNQLEVDHPGAKMNFYSSFQAARKNGFLNLMDEDGDSAQNQCPRCGQLTSREGLCAYCRLADRA